MSFFERATALPRLGLGISTEYGAFETSGGLDVAELRRKHPLFAGFLEVGVETVKGLDTHTRAWVAQGLPTTYHFLDINLDDPAEFDSAWLDSVRDLARDLSPAWMCGDAGLWHFGRRERGHMLLLPPVLSDESAWAMAEGIVRLREETGHEVFPENPPGTVYLGDLHLLDFFARVIERADTGMLLDCAHLAIYQLTQGHDPMAGLDGFPGERIIEMHVAGTTTRQQAGYSYLDDDHTTQVMPETWRLFDHLVPRASNLKAVVFECERNRLPETLPGFGRIARALESFAGTSGDAVPGAMDPNRGAIDPNRGVMDPDRGAMDRDG